MAVHFLSASGVRIQHSVLMEGVKVLDSAWINGSIIGWKSVVGRWCRVEPMTVTGKDVT